jgi:NTP pyrophosphatase (non-canonical NTP hydrolase)
MYYIYHDLRTNKIGCTKNLKKRVEKEQGITNYKILYTTNNINEASDKEIEFQIKYGSKVDKIPYNKLNIYKMNNKIYVTKQTITFKDVYNDYDFFKNFNDLKFIEVPDFGKIIINDEVRGWIMKNLKTSVKGKSNFIYIESLNNFAKSRAEQSQFDLIREWAKKRGLYENGNPNIQYIKLQEECGELAKALLENNQTEIIDAIGDIVVVLTNLAQQKEVLIEECISSAYNEIKERTGKMINGTFVKKII